MRQTHPLPIHHSWPLHDRARQFALGQLLDHHPLDTELATADAIAAALPGGVRIGEWSCDLADNGLHWSGEVYRLFGLPDAAAVTRDETVALYCEPSRAAMERLRAYAIRHRRGFTLDAEIQPMQGPRRWMRLVAAPICEGDAVVKLQGLKIELPARA
ncbi:MAG: hypothetical protein JNL35_10780 [Sphingopyxis sp.]|nr:hypothetical protein [Sphingopyxis sp.]